MSQNPPVVRVPVCSTCRRRECRVEALIAERHALSPKLATAYFPADVAAHKIADKSANDEIAVCNRISRERKAADAIQFDLCYQRRLDDLERRREFVRDSLE